MVAAAGVKEATVRRIWHAGSSRTWGGHFKVSNDPESADKLEAIAGLYLISPSRARRSTYLRRFAYETYETPCFTRAAPQRPTGRER